MKAIKWAGTGASLLDPVYAHMITPKYEHVAKRRCCCVPVLLRAGVAACRCCCVPVARVQQRPERSVDHASSNDRNGSVDSAARSHLAFIRGGAAPSAA